MIEAEFELIYPDDDGRKQRAWIVDGQERGISACERVMDVLSKRSWIPGGAEQTQLNSEEDEHGIDIYVPMNRRLVSFLGIEQDENGVCFQVKSSNHAVTRFVNLHRRSIFNARKRVHLFVLDGQDAKDVIKADIVGQMIIIAGLAKNLSEEKVLKFLAEQMGDKEIVDRYLENKEIIIDSKWYGGMFEE